MNSVSHHLDLFYYRKGHPQPLDEYAKDIYDAWTTIFPNPLDLSHVKECAGDDKEKAAGILKKALLADSSMARSRYRWKIENRQDVEGFWQPKHVRAGLITFAYLIKRTVKWDDFSRWSSQEYIDAVMGLKDVIDGMKRAEKNVYSYHNLEKPSIPYIDAVEIHNAAKFTTKQALQTFMQKKIVVHIM
ncbi:hypothetical protein V5O48_014941 [Marasmius crinis-equi]|uniref:Uncharacterized protein n=1 Tax=Marasmius crinis-equi TaxID=585013 RepID=A0ABR3EVW8_9AGAR